MNKLSKDAARQLAAARKAMDRYRPALQALATAPDEKLERQIEVERERMKKYETVYRELSKR